MPAHDHNRRAWDERARSGARFARPATDDEIARPDQLTDAALWLGDVRGKQLLCLAAGGGKHGPLYAAAGAEVTVVDISGEMLALDRQVATVKRLSLRTVEASMDDLARWPRRRSTWLSAGEYVLCAGRAGRVSRSRPRAAPGGLYLSQYKQPASLRRALGRAGGLRTGRAVLPHGPAARRCW
jgi:SAM-dependent methyltransferase